MKGEAKLALDLSSNDIGVKGAALLGVSDVLPAATVLSTLDLADNNLKLAGKNRTKMFVTNSVLQEANTFWRVYPNH